jgi:hypothetical protein
VPSKPRPSIAEGGEEGDEDDSEIEAADLHRLD